jgi:hypothetical protein
MNITSFHAAKLRQSLDITFGYTIYQFHVQIVTAVQDRQLDRSPLLHLVYKIKRLSLLDRVCKFVRVDRSHVRVSHCLANLLWF